MKQAVYQHAAETKMKQGGEDSREQREDHCY